MPVETPSWPFQTGRRGGFQTRLPSSLLMGEEKGEGVPVLFVQSPQGEEVIPSPSMGEGLGWGE